MNEETSTSNKSEGVRAHVRVSTNGCRKGKWTLMNLGAVVLGFVAAWPIGLVCLCWVLSGRHIGELPKATRQAWDSLKGLVNGEDWTYDFSKEHASDNVMFNEYQQTQWDRIQEIRDDISQRRERFENFRADVKRRADEEEFRRFMNESPINGK